MSWRTLSAEEKEVLTKGFHRATIPAWASGLLVAELLCGHEHLDGVLVSYQEQGKGFTICTVLNILRDGSMELRVGVSRKRDEDQPFPLRGRIEAFKRALWAQPQTVQTKRQEALRSGRPNGLMRIQSIDGSIHDRDPRTISALSWFPGVNDLSNRPPHTRILLYGGEVLQDRRYIDEIWAEKELAESELKS